MLKLHKIWTKRSRLQRKEVQKQSEKNNIEGKQATFNQIVANFDFGKTRHGCQDKIKVSVLPTPPKSVLQSLMMSTSLV
jgi:hypothetical protein